MWLCREVFGCAVTPMGHRTVSQYRNWITEGSTGYILLAKDEFTASKATATAFDTVNHKVLLNYLHNDVIYVGTLLTG